MNTDFNTMTLHERINLADDPSTPSEVLDHLSHDPDKDVRCRVAGNPSTPSDVLDRLSYDPDVNVRAWAWDSIEERGLMELLGD